MSWWTRFLQPKIVTNSPYQKALQYNYDTQGSGLYAWQNGQTLFRYPTDSDDLHDIFSGSKTIIALAFLSLLEEKKLTLTDRASDYIPEFKTGGRQNITVRELLTLTSGLEADNVIANFLPYETAKNARKLKNRGFEYGATSYQVLGLIFKKVCPRQKLENYLKKRFFTPLGIINYEWSEVFDNDNMVSWGLKLRLEDWAKFGILILFKGSFNGQQLLQPKTIRLLTKTTQANPYFGLSTWSIKRGQTSAIISKSSGITREFTVKSFARIISHLRRLNFQQVIFCVGLNSQRLYIIPEKKLVIARFASIEDLHFSDYQLIRKIVTVLEKEKKN